MPIHNNRRRVLLLMLVVQIFSIIIAVSNIPDNNSRTMSTSLPNVSAEIPLPAAISNLSIYITEARTANSSEEKIVITPGGPRPQEKVHQVEPDEIALTNNETVKILSKMNVSVDRVLTPGGFRPKSVVHEISLGNVIRRINGSLQVISPSNEVLADFGPATTSGVNASLKSKNVSIVPIMGNGWISYAYWTENTNNWIISFKTTWIVPPAPTTQSGQTIFLFNGIENSVPWILQPVLQWGPSAAGGGNYWSVASWYVDGEGGLALHSPLVQVNPGDTLIGVMSLTAWGSDGFSYNCRFQDRPQTSLDVQQVEELFWSIETLETYGITKCSDYPATAFTAFTNIGIATTEWPTLSWTPVNTVVDCGQHTEVVSNANPGGVVNIHYNNNPPGKAVLTQNPTFVWNMVDGSSWYYLWVDGPSGNVIKKWYPANDVTWANMCYAMPSVNLASGSYTWWIQTWNDAGYGPWSEPRSFSVATPEKCQLISPSGSITSTKPTYQWNRVLGSTWYYLWINGPSGKIFGKWYTAAEVTSGPFCQITPDVTLTPGSGYTWYIQTWNDAGYGPWSDSKSFTVS